MLLEAAVRRLELEQLYTDYVHCLDADEIERWPDFFTEDCFYRVTSAENYEAGMPLGLIRATSRAIPGFPVRRRADRITTSPPPPGPPHRRIR